MVHMIWEAIVNVLVAPYGCDPKRERSQLTAELNDHNLRASIRLLQARRHGVAVRPDRRLPVLATVESELFEIFLAWSDAKLRSVLAIPLTSRE